MKSKYKIIALVLVSCGLVTLSSALAFGLCSWFASSHSSRLDSVLKMLEEGDLGIGDPAMPILIALGPEHMGESYTDESGILYSHLVYSYSNCVLDVYASDRQIFAVQYFDGAHRENSQWYCLDAVEFNLFIDLADKNQ